jgi:cytochrome c oxidase subunit 2
VIQRVDRFHDYTILVIGLVLCLILVWIVDLVLIKSPMSRFIEHTTLEIWWTITPGLILVALALPSLNLLYSIDEVESPDIRLSVLGHQWFWEYSYPDFGLRFESYLDQSYNASRILEVDNRVVLPYNSVIRVLVRAVDVLHSWAMPSIGLKVDAIPGRLNQLTLRRVAPGLFYGQCSEICGANHRFIPIVLEIVNKHSFIAWIQENRS